MKRRRFTIMAALAAVAAGVVAAVAWAGPGNVGVQYKMPVTAKFEGFPKVCDNKGSEIDISGELSFPGVGIDVRFENQNNNTDYSGPGKGKGWKDSYASSTASMTIYDLALETLPKQPARLGVGGNPWIYIQLVEDNAERTPLGEPILLGRCVVGNSYRSGKYTNYIDADAEAVLSMLGCDQQGAFVDVGTQAGHNGIDADVIFTNNRKFTHARDVAGKVSLELTDAIHARKGQVLNGGNKVTGNPHVSARFKDHNNVPLQDYIALGRCNQLG